LFYACVFVRGKKRDTGTSSENLPSAEPEGVPSENEAIPGGKKKERYVKLAARGRGGACRGASAGGKRERKAKAFAKRADDARREDEEDETEMQEPIRERGKRGK